MDVDSFRCRTGSNRIQMNWLNVDQFNRIELNQTNLVNLTAKLDVDDLIELDCDSIKPDWTATNGLDRMTPIQCNWGDLVKLDSTGTANKRRKAVTSPGLGNQRWKVTTRRTHANLNEINATVYCSSNQVKGHTLLPNRGAHTRHFRYPHLHLLLPPGLPFRFLSNVSQVWITSLSSTPIVFSSIQVVLVASQRQIHHPHYWNRLIDSKRS